MNKGPNLIILWEEGSKNVLGGFAMASWKAGPKFFGSNQNFLFNLKPRAYVYEASSFNENYQYMNVKAKTMPNGIGKIFLYQKTKTQTNFEIFEMQSKLFLLISSIPRNGWTVGILWIVD